jgi:hypothetical protein
MLDYRKHIPELKQFQFVPYMNNERGVFRLGQVTFFHGFQAGSTSDTTEGLLLGVPFGLTVRGHTHRMLPVTRLRKSPTVPLPYWACNSGTLGPLKPEYARRLNTSEWGHGITVGSARIGRKIYPEPQWEAKVVVLDGVTDETERSD